MNIFNIDWKAPYTYALLLGASLFMWIFFSEDRMNVPSYGTGLFLLAWIVMAGTESFKRWMEMGPKIVTTLEGNPCEGILEQFDLSETSQLNETNFAIVALGGFMYAKFYDYGKKAFLIFPPEHLEKVGNTMVLRTYFRRIDFSQVPDYIQDRLVGLRGFKLDDVIKKQNLWWGTSSPFLGTTTASRMYKETEYLEQRATDNIWKKHHGQLTQATVKEKKGQIRSDVEWEE